MDLVPGKELEVVREAGGGESRRERSHKPALSSVGQGTSHLQA